MTSEKTLKAIEKYKKKIEDSTKSVSLSIFILGKGFPQGSECLECCDSCEISDCVNPKRRKIVRETLNEEGHIAMFPEQLELIYPSCDEHIIFQDPEIDLLIIFPESAGSIGEFSQFMGDIEIAPKMRVFIPKEFHPLYGNITSYVSDEYLRFIVNHGHVYFFEHDSELFTIIKKLTDMIRKVKYLNLRNV